MTFKMAPDELEKFKNETNVTMTILYFTIL